MASEVRSMLPKGTTESGAGNKGFYIYPFLIPKKNVESHPTINLKPLNQFITCIKFQMTTLKQMREVIHPEQWAVSLDIKSVYCHIPTVRRHHCFLCFRWWGKVYQSKTFPFSLSTAPKTFTRVMKAILLQCQKMGITVFLYLDDAPVLANSYSQAKEDGQKVVQLLHRLGFMLILKKCQLEPTQECTHLGLVLNTQNITVSLPQDKVLEIKAQAAKVSSFSRYWCNETVGLENFCQHWHDYVHIPYSSASRRITRFQLTCSRGWGQTQRQSKPCTGGVPSSQSKINMQTLNRVSSHDRCFKGGLLKPHEQPAIQRHVACKEGQTPTSISWNWKQ